MATPGMLDDSVFEEIVGSYGQTLDPGVVESVNTEVPDPVAPRTLQETFGRGFDSGRAGLQSGGQYFSALFNSLVGDEDDRDIALANAREFDNTAAVALRNIQTFEEFKDNPTFSGGLTQFMLGAGQAAPSGIATIASALATGGTSLLANVGGRALIKGGSALAAKKVIKEAAENVAEDVATPDEKKLVDSVYEALKGFTGKRGMVVGGTAAGYVPMAGQNFSEGLEAGREADDIDLAIRSLTVAAPQAALEIAAPIAVLKSLGKVAKSKSVGDESSIMGGLVKDISKATFLGGTTEMATEAGQETISVLNRMSMDPDYDTEEAQLRIAQAAFYGMAGGKAFGAAGGTLAGGSRAVNRILSKASDQVQQGKEQQQDQQDDEERYGDLYSGMTTPESSDTLNAQLDAVVNENSTKKAMWAEGRKPDGIEPNTVTEFEHNGKTLYAGHIPGKGTIFGSKEIVSEVLADGATDEKLGQVLGYSNFKPMEGGRVVVQALDEKGNVVSEELTNKQGRKAAVQAAKGLSPIGKHRVISVDKALSERKKRFDAEQSAAESTETTEPATQFNVGDEVTIQFDEVERGGAALRDDEIAPVTAKVRRIKRADGTVFYEAKDPRPNSGSIIFSEADIESGKVTLNPTQEQQDSLKAKRDAAKKALQEKARKENENDPEMQEAARQAAALQREREQFQRRKKQAQENFKPKDEQGLLAAIAARGGISRTDLDVRENSTFFKEHFRERVGSKFVFTNNGKSMTEMFEDLQGDGWYPPDPDGRPNEYGSDALREDLIEALGSDEPFYTPMKSDIAMEAQARQREEDAKARRDFEFEAEPPKFKDLGPAPTEQGGLFDEPVKPEIKNMEVPREVQEAFAGQAFNEVDLEETSDVVEGTIKKDPNRTFDNTRQAREAFMAMFGEVNWNEQFYAGMTETFLQKVADAQLNAPDAEFNITLEEGKYIARKTDKKPDPLDVSKEGVIRTLLNAAQDKNARGSGAFLITPDGRRRPINLASLATAGKALLNRRGENIYDEKLVPPREAATRGLSTFLADMQLAETGYDIQIGKKSIFEIDSSRPLREQVDSDYVTGAIVDKADATLTDLLQPKTEAARPVTYTVRGEEGTGRSRQGTTNVFYGSNQNAELSNLALRPFTYEGREYKTVEHAYQSLKSGQFDQTTYDKYNRLPNPAGKKIVGKSADTKDNANIRLMENLMRASFEQNPQAMKALKATGSAKITHTQDKGVWRKEFPRILTSIRGTAPAKRGGGSPFPEQTFDNRRDAEAFVADVEARGGIATITDNKPTYFDPTFMEDQTEGSTFTEGSSEAFFASIGENVDPDSAMDESSRIRERQLYDEAGMPIPKTRLNLEMDPKYQLRGRQTNRTSTYKLGLAVNFATGSLGKMTDRIVTRLNQIIKPQKTIHMFGVKELKNMNTDEILGMFDDRVVGKIMIQQYQELAASETTLGRYISFPNAHVILVDNTKGNPLQNALVAAHEMGHVLFKEEQNRALSTGSRRQKLLDDYHKSKHFKDGLDFEEWFADQTAIYAKAIYFKERKAAKGVTQRMFQKLAQKLVNMWRNVLPSIRERLDKRNTSDAFTDFIDNTVRAVEKNVATDRATGVGDIRFEAKVLVRDMETAQNDKMQKAVGNIFEKFAGLLDNAPGHTLLRVILPEDNILRKISPKIADMFYVQSNAESAKVGFIKAKDHVRGQLYNQLEKMLGSDWDTDEVNNALIEAATDTPSSELKNPKAREVRKWLEDLWENYISKVPGNEIGRRENYFPLVLDLHAISENPEAFIDLIMANKPDQSRDDIRKVIDGLVARQQAVLNDEVEITFDATDPVSVVEKARQLTDGIPPQDIKAFIESPQIALMKYIRHVITRSEFKRATTDDKGNNLLEAELNKLSKEERVQAIKVVERYLGYTTTPMNPKLQKLQSYVQMFNWVTLLPLATIGSITELGGAIVNSRELNGFEFAAKAIKRNMENREQARELARTIGVAWTTAMGNLGLTDADAEYLDPKVRKWSDKFFQKIGLDWFTRFTREFASATAVEFLFHHADSKTGGKRSERYLRDHGVTAEQVNSWRAKQKDGEHFTFDGEDGKAVKAALQRFVENSMLRPNAAERPAWANDPRYQLVWALKSYLYSFGKVIIGGMKREMGKRLGEGGTTMEQMSAVGMVGLLAAVSFMPLAMMSLEFRELAKAGIAGILPGVEANARYFRSDRMEYGDYLAEMFDRSGFAGPLAIVTSAFKSVEWGQTGVGAIFGPTAGLLIDDIGMGLYRGKGWEIVPARIIPGYSTVL